MSALPESPSVIENVRLSSDCSCLLLALADTDPEVVAFAKAGGLEPDPVAAAKRFLRLGVIAGSAGPYQATLSDLMRAAQQIDALRDLPHQVAAELGKAIGEQLARIVGDGERPGAIGAALDAITTDAGARLSKVIAPVQERLLGSGPGALPQLLEARLTGALGREAAAILQRLYATDGTSPLMAHLDNGAKAVEALRQETAGLERRLRDQIGELARQVAVQKAGVPAPIDVGRAWEADAIDDVARVTAILGDTVEAAGDTTGHGTSRAGDAVLHVADDAISGLKVAIECRTGTSRRVTVEGLRAAMANRDAHAGLLLADRAELLPRDAQAAGFRVYWADRLVALHHDRGQPNSGQMLAIAIQVSRLLAKLAVSASGGLAERENLRSAIGRIETALAHLRPLRASVTGVEKEAAKISQHAGGLEAEIRKALIDLAILVEVV
jgi:hypothetical protein